MVRPVPEPGTRVFYGVSDLSVLGAASNVEEELEMARLIGTGRDPLGQYPEGIVVDVPGGTPQYRALVEQGYVLPLDPADDPSVQPEVPASFGVGGDYGPTMEEMADAPPADLAAMSVSRSGLAAAIAPAKAAKAKADADADDGKDDKAKK